MKPSRFLPHRPTVRVGKLRRRLLYLLVLALLVTGAWWLVLHSKASEDALPDPTLAWLMKVHGGAAMLILFMAGTFLHNHVLNAWQQRRNRVPGSIAAGGLLLLALSGYGLYYFDGEQLRGFAEWLHWIIGFGTPLLLWWHIASGRRHRKQRRKDIAFPGAHQERQESDQ